MFFLRERVFVWKNLSIQVSKKDGGFNKGNNYGPRKMGDSTKITMDQERWGIQQR